MPKIFGGKSVDKIFIIDDTFPPFQAGIRFLLKNTKTVSLSEIKAQTATGSFYRCPERDGLQLLLANSVNDEMIRQLKDPSHPNFLGENSVLLLDRSITDGQHAGAIRDGMVIYQRLIAGPSVPGTIISISTESDFIEAVGKSLPKMFNLKNFTTVLNATARTPEAYAYKGEPPPPAGMAALKQRSFKFGQADLVDSEAAAGGDGAPVAVKLSGGSCPPSTMVAVGGMYSSSRRISSPTVKPGTPTGSVVQTSVDDAASLKSSPPSIGRNSSPTVRLGIVTVRTGIDSPGLKSSPPSVNRNASPAWVGIAAAKPTADSPTLKSSPPSVGRNASPAWLGIAAAKPTADSPTLKSSPPSVGRNASPAWLGIVAVRPTEDIVAPRSPPLPCSGVASAAVDKPVVAAVKATKLPSPLGKAVTTSEADVPGTGSGAAKYPSRNESRIAASRAAVFQDDAGALIRNAARPPRRSVAEMELRKGNRGSSASPVWLRSTQHGFAAYPSAGFFGTKPAPAPGSRRDSVYSSGERTSTFKTPGTSE